MSNKKRHLFAKTPDRARPVAGHREPFPEHGHEEASDLTIELLEERLAPGYPARWARKTAGWGC
jgi:hypothetical protein